MNSKPNEWNLIYFPDFAIFDLVFHEDLEKVKLKFIILFSGKTKVELVEKLSNELNRLLFIEGYKLELTEEEI